MHFPFSIAFGDYRHDSAKIKQAYLCSRCSDNF